MRIDSVQNDQSMRPLGRFLFKCEFSNKLGDTVVSGDVLSDKMLKNLMYSVLGVEIPKLETSDSDSLSYGSFAVSFPFFSTEKKEMRMSFYETDQMEIFKTFTYLLSKSRWKASTMFRWEQADLYVTVTIYDQRNLYGQGYRALFCESYALKTTRVEPPQFSRTNDADLLKTEVIFNTVQTRNYDRGQISSVDADREFRENDRRADPAFTNSEDMANTIAKYFEDKFKTEYEDRYAVDLDRLRYQQSIPELAEIRASKGTKGGDFILDQGELDSLYEIHRSHEGENAMTKEAFSKMNQSNLDKLAKGYLDMNRSLDGTGFSISVNTVNDSKHKYSSTAASHETSSKMDLTILKNGEKVTVGSLSEAEAEQLRSAADSAGLVLNFEKKAGDPTSLWVDAHPKVISTPKGEKSVDKSWTGMWRNVHVDGAKYDVDLVTGEVIERGATRRTAQQKMNIEAEDARRANEREVSSMNKKSQDASASILTKTSQRVSTLPPADFKELKKNPRGSFNSTSALLGEK